MRSHCTNWKQYTFLATVLLLLSSAPASINQTRQHGQVLLSLKHNSTCDLFCYKAHKRFLFLRILSKWSHKNHAEVRNICWCYTFQIRKFNSCNSLNDNVFTHLSQYIHDWLWYFDSKINNPQSYYPSKQSGKITSTSLKQRNTETKNFYRRYISSQTHMLVNCNKSILQNAKSVSILHAMA